jgi:hypothetical protein
MGVFFFPFFIKYKMTLFKFDQCSSQQWDLNVLNIFKLRNVFNDNEFLK